MRRESASRRTWGKRAVRPGTPRARSSTGLPHDPCIHPAHTPLSNALGLQLSHENWITRHGPGLLSATATPSHLGPLERSQFPLVALVLPAPCEQRGHVLDPVVGVEGLRGHIERARLCIRQGGDGPDVDRGQEALGPVEPVQEGVGGQARVAQGEGVKLLEQAVLEQALRASSYVSVLHGRHEADRLNGTAHGVNHDCRHLHHPQPLDHPRQTHP